MSAFKNRLENLRERKVLPDLYDFPIHKRIFDFKHYSKDVLEVIKDWFSLEISLDSLIKLQKSLPESPTPFELKVINSYWSCGKGHFNRKIAEIQIASENPHILSALNLYNSLKEYDGTQYYPRTLKDLSNMGHVAERRNGLFSIYNTNDTAQMECYAYDKGIRSNYYLSLNTIWDYNGISASSKALNNAVVNGSFPIGAIYKEYAGGSYRNRLEFSKFIDDLEIPTYECPSSLNNNVANPVVKVSMLGFHEKKPQGFNPKNNDKILLVKSRHSIDGLKEHFGAIQKILSEFPSMILNTNDGILNTLIDAFEGFNLQISGAQVGDGSVEDFLLNENSNNFIIVTKNKHLSSIKNILRDNGFDSFIIGSISKENYYRLINEDVELMKLSSKIVKYHIHDYSIFRIEDNVIKQYPKLYEGFNEKEASSYVRMNLALGRFNPNSIFSGVSSGLSIRPPLLGKKQMTKMHALQLAPSVNRFENSCTMITSNVNTQVGDSDFSITVNAVVSALMKLVVLGVPLCDTAISCNLLYDVSGNRLVRGAVLAKSLACLYAQNSLSVGSMGNSLELMHNMEADGILADITAIGTMTRENSLTNLFKKGDKIYRFRIPRDEFDIPDFKYIIKLASHINMNINIGSVTSGLVVEHNVVDSIIKGTAGDSLGFSFAKIDESLFDMSAGDILLAVSDEWDVDFLGGKYIGVVDDSGEIKGVNTLITQEEIERIVSKHPFENNPYYRLQKVEVRPQNSRKPLGNHVELRALILHTEDSAEHCVGEVLNKCGYNVSSIKISELSITDRFAKQLREQIVKANLIVCCGRSMSNSTHNALYNALRNPVILDALNQLIFSNDGLILCTGEGARTFLELGYLACGTAEMGKPINLSLDENPSNEKPSKLPRLMITNNHSPFLKNIDLNSVFLSANAGYKLKFVSTDEVRRVFNATGQIAMQYVDYLGYPTIVYPDNPYGSQRGIAALSSPNGRILGLFSQPELVTKLIGERSLLEEMLLSAKEFFNSMEE